jgi:hypothetical protein
VDGIHPASPKRIAWFSGTALLIAALQFGSLAIVCYSLWSVPRHQPHRNMEWGEGLGFLIFLLWFVAAQMILTLTGLLLAFLSRWRREQPVWLYRTAMFIYAPAAVGAIAIAIWGLSRR